MDESTRKPESKPLAERFRNRGSRVVELVQWFEYEHLSGPARETSAVFHDTAHLILRDNPVDSDQLLVSLQKLLEAKDAAVRATIDYYQNVLSGRYSYSEEGYELPEPRQPRRPIKDIPQA